ncbi:unnamed protein product [Paramecium sonneborni]|uniref:WD40-repeat-containing domain n=1 Tax=Paramecium sonneborni TaxID=65129 RepID=A0A8S1PDX8_9CILI|nr:unnamed protein product [Paramecium sonneborni]
MNQQKNNGDQLKFIKIASKKQREWCQAIAINDDCSQFFIGFKTAIKVFVFNEGNLKQLQILNHHTNYITDLKLCNCQLLNSNQCLISASDDKTIILWQQSGQKSQNQFWNYFQRLYGHQDKINCLSILETKYQIVSGSADKSIKIWSISNPKQNLTCSQTIQNHSSEIWALSINQCQDTIISSGEDRIILIIEYNNEIWIVKQKINVMEYGYRICFINNNLFCFQPISSKQLHIYQLNSNQVYIKSKEINVQGGDYYCKPYFPSIYINQKQLLINKNGCKVNIIRTNIQNDEQLDLEFILEQVIDFGTTDGWGYLYGSISNNGQYLVTWDYKSEEIQIMQLQVIQIRQQQQ